MRQLRGGHRNKPEVQKIQNLRPKISGGGQAQAICIILFQYGVGEVDKY